MPITFAVDDVVPLPDALPTRPSAEVFAALTGAPIHALAPESPLLDFPAGAPRHALAAAVHRAFAGHRPLVLTPDAIWLTIAQGFARHVEENAGTLRHRLVRHRLVRHEGRAPIQVRVQRPPKDAGEWADAIEAFGNGIAEHVGPGVHRLLRCDFSTTDPVARTASEVVMMSAFRRFFEYRMVCICGIPRITLEGTADDWRDIRRRLDVLAEYDLGWWIERLAPVADAWVRTAEGAPDRDFWQCIYKPREAYGAEMITGWVQRLYPYVEWGKGRFVRNPSLAPPDDIAAASTPRRGLLDRLLGRRPPDTDPRRARWIDTGVSSANLPGGLSVARLRLMDGTGEVIRPMTSLRLVGGLVGVAVDPDGALRPTPGWAVSEADRPTRLVEALRQSARVAAHDGRSALPFWSVPAELVAFGSEIGEAWMGSLHLRPMASMMVVQAGPDGFSGRGPDDAAESFGHPSEHLFLAPVADLGPDDPRWLGMAVDGAIGLVDPRRRQQPADIPVVADDYGALIERALESADGPPWFDRPAFTATCTLAGAGSSDA